MKKHLVISLIIIVVVLCPAFAYANFAMPTSSFGGKVIATSLPFTSCYSFGTGPILLSSNLESLGSAVTSSVGSGQPTTARVSNTVSGIYGAIPFYAQYSFSSTMPFISATPKAGDWILGRASIIPNFTTCAIKDFPVIPFPVRTTSNYKVSSAVPGGL